MTHLKTAIISLYSINWLVSVPFEKFRKATVSFFIPVRPSIRMKQLDSHWTDFYEIWYLDIFLKSIEKIQVWL